MMALRKKGPPTGALFARTAALFLAACGACTPATPATTSPSPSSAPVDPAPGVSSVASVPSAPSPAPAVVASGDAGDGGVALDIIYVPTPQKVVEKMLEVAHVTRSDVVYDLGCGDGRIEKLRPGSRIVSHDFDMQGVIPDGHWTIMAPEFVNEEGYSAYKGGAVPEDKKNYKERAHDIYLWTVPLKKSAVRSADADAGHGATK